MSGCVSCMRMYACMYVCMYVYICICGTYTYAFLCNLFLRLSMCLIEWMDCPLLGCSARPLPGRWDSPGPGGRHRGQDYGKQIQQPLWQTTSHNIYWISMKTRKLLFWKNIINVCIYFLYGLSINVCMYKFTFEWGIWFIHTYIHSWWSVYKVAMLYRGCTDC